MKVLKKVKPMFNRIITTMDSYEKDQYINGVIDSRKQKGTMKEYQTVVSVGDTVRGINEGDIVCINPTRYAVMKHNDKSMQNGIIGDNMVLGYKFNTITIDGKEHLMLYDQDIDFVVVESEDVEDQSAPLLIQPEEKKFII
jgi:threonine dehydrogenase-like Zn-dependent dehydrogenase